MSSSSRQVQRCLEILRIYRDSGKLPTFSSILGLDYHHFVVPPPSSQPIVMKNDNTTTLSSSSSTSTSEISSSISSSSQSSSRSSRHYHEDAPSPPRLVLDYQNDTNTLNIRGLRLPYNRVSLPALPVVPPQHQQQRQQQQQHHQSQFKTATTATEKTVSVSTFMAVMDEVTTFALMIQDPKRGRPGVSVSMNGTRTTTCCRPHIVQDAGNGHDFTSPANSTASAADNNTSNAAASTTSSAPEEEKEQQQQELVVNVAARVDKIGYNLGFTSARIYHAGTGQLVFYGSHVKFMNHLDWLSSFMLSQYGWNLTLKGLELYREYCKNDKTASYDDDKDSNNMTMSELLESFQVIPNDNNNNNKTENDDSVLKSFTFAAKREHHSSPGGLLHGGLQAILMELAATYVAREQMIVQIPANHNDNDVVVQLESMSVDYVASPKSLNPILHVENISRDESSSRIVLCVKLCDGDHHHDENNKKHDERVCSRGVCHFVARRRSNNNNKNRHAE